MASFTERYHEFTKYNPHTIDRLGEVRWNNQPRQFKELIEEEPLSLTPYLQFLKEPTDQFQWDSLADPTDSLELSYLARLLYFTCGVSSLYETPQQVYYFRCNPSAGGLYPIEVYLCTSSKHPLGEGLWFFHPLQMALGRVGPQDAYNTLLKEVAGAEEDPPQAFLVYSGKFSRGEWRYKQRTYRRMLLDLGHALENTTLFTEFSHRSIKVFPSFDDQKILELNFLDEDEVPLMFVGLESYEDIQTLCQSENPTPQESYERIAKLEEPMMYKQNQVEFVRKPFTGLECKASRPEKAFEFHRFLETLPRSIRHRRSCRDFANSPVPFDWLERALKIAFVTPEIMMSKNHLKFALAVQNVENLSQATYDLSPIGEILTDTPRALSRETMAEACLGQEIALNASVLLIAYSDLNEATAQMGDRVYRYLCADAGRIGQRLNLVCTDSPMGMSGVGGYFDDLINETLGLEVKNAILYVMALGVSKEERGYF